MEQSAVPASSQAGSVAAPPIEPTLADLLAGIWRARWFVMVGGAFGALLAYVLILYAVPQYKASMLVAPYEKSGRPVSPDMAAMLSASYDGGFASLPFMQGLAQNAADGGRRQDFVRFEARLRGVTVAKALMAREDKDFTLPVAQDVRFRFPVRNVPETAEAFAAYLEKAVRVEQAGSTPVRKITYLHPDRDFAVSLLQALTGQADRLIYDETVRENEARLSYLRKALVNTAHPDHRRVLTSLLMEQEHLKMMLAMEGPLAARIIEPPAATARPHWPNKTLFYTVSVLVGLFAGYALGSVFTGRKAFY